MSILARKTALAALAALVLLPGAAAASAPAHGGSGITTATIAEVAVGDLDSISFSADRAEAGYGSDPRALASLVTGRSGSVTIGADKRSARTPEESGRSTVRGEALRLDTALDLHLSGGELVTEIRPSDSRAAISLGYARASVLDGAVTMDGLSGVTEIVAGHDETRALRRLAVESLTVLSVGDLLERLGIDPLSLGCDAVEQTGARLSVDTSAACDELAGVRAAVAGARAEMAAAIDGLVSERGRIQAAVADATARRDALLAQRDAVAAELDGHDRATAEEERAIVAGLCEGLSPALAAICEATAMVTTLPAYAEQYGLSVLPPVFTDARDAVVAAVDDVLAGFDELDAIDDAIAALDAELLSFAAQLDDAIDAIADGESATLVDDRCASLDGALAGVADAAPDAAGALSAAREALAERCAALRGLVDRLLVAPILRLDGVDISIEVAAREGEPSARMTGSAESIRVGLGSALELGGLDETLAGVNEAVRGAVAEVNAALGLGLPAPTLDLFVFDSGHGQRDDGSWFADGTLSIVRLGLPAGTVTVPDEPPLGVLDAGGAAAAGAPARAAADTPTPPVSMDVGMIAAEADYTAAGGGGDLRDPDPDPAPEPDPDPAPEPDPAPGTDPDPDPAPGSDDDSGSGSDPAPGSDDDGNEPGSGPDSDGSTTIEGSTHDPGRLPRTGVAGMAFAGIALLGAAESLRRWIRG